MSKQADIIVEEEAREYWWEQGEAVMREMMEDEKGLDDEIQVKT